MLHGIKQQAIVGKDGKIEIQATELTEGTLVEVIVLVEQEETKTDTNQPTSHDTTDYLLSTQANRAQLMSAIQNIKTQTNVICFTPEEWNEEYNLRS